MRQIICPVCATKSLSDHPSEQSLLDCQSCGVSWTFFQKDIDSDALYSDEVYAVVDNRKSIFERIIFSEARKTLRIAENQLPTKERRLLDFGSGKGQFLLAAKERDWDALGIETATERAEFAREKYNVNVISEFYDTGKIGVGQFDFISLNHVLEHLPSPISLLQKLIVHNLSDQGLVYIEVPRRNSWQAKISGMDWMHWDIPKHLTHWTEPVLIDQMSKIGMRKKASRRFSIHLGVLGMLQVILSFFGYKGNLILNLKREKSPFLMLAILVILPFALIIETIACFFNRGGILGTYFVADGKY